MEVARKRDVCMIHKPKQVIHHDAGIEGSTEESAGGLTPSAIVTRRSGAKMPAAD